MPPVAFSSPSTINVRTGATYRTLPEPFLRVCKYINWFPSGHSARRYWCRCRAMQYLSSTATAHLEIPRYAFVKIECTAEVVAVRGSIIIQRRLKCSMCGCSKKPATSVHCPPLLGKKLRMRLDRRLLKIILYLLFPFASYSLTRPYTSCRWCEKFCIRAETSIYTVAGKLLVPIAPYSEAGLATKLTEFIRRLFLYVRSWANLVGWIRTKLSPRCSVSFCGM